MGCLSAIIIETSSHKYVENCFISPFDTYIVVHAFFFMLFLILLIMCHNNTIHIIKSIIVECFNGMPNNVHYTF